MKQRKLTPKEVAIQDIAKEVKQGNFKQNYLRVEKRVKELCQCPRLTVLI
jgi:hypothetical protein